MRILGLHNRSLLSAVAVLATLTLGACSSGGDDPDANTSDATSDATSSGAPTDGTTDTSSEPTQTSDIGAADETFDEAVTRISDALASDDCTQIAAIAWGAGDGLSVKQTADQCDVFKTRFGSEPPAKTVAMGAAGGVLAFDPPDRKVTRAVLIADADGLLRPIFFDYVPSSDKLTGNGKAGPFAKVADKALKAMKKGDCDALAAVSHFVHPRDWVCGLTEGSLAQALKAKDRKLETLGVSSDYALFGIQGKGVHWVLVMARQPVTSKSAAHGYPKNKAPAYVLATAVKVAD
jgi:hypothetical protein